MALTCASARLGLCLMADAPILLICGGNNTGPRHKCSKCRGPVHGNACGVQLTDEEQLKQKGISVPFDISCLPSEGQAEMKSFNNDGCILCLACAKDIAKTLKIGCSKAKEIVKNAIQKVVKKYEEADMDASPDSEGGST